MKLVDPCKINKIEFDDFINEFKIAKEEFVPYSINQKNMDFSTYIKSITNEGLGIGIADNWVPASTYFLISDNSNKIYGATNIRHRLTESLKIEGGHIGYGIRPSERKNGYGKLILGFGLDILRKMNINKVLVTCDKKNIASSKVILKNGGKLDSEIEKDNILFQRYWILL